ncbi:hypothetical protein MMPV_009864 [Pyropia vietnamensis]
MATVAVTNCDDVAVAASSTLVIADVLVVADDGAIWGDADGVGVASGGEEVTPRGMSTDDNQRATGATADTTRYGAAADQRVPAAVSAVEASVPALPWWSAVPRRSPTATTEPVWDAHPSAGGWTEAGGTAAVHIDSEGGWVI